MIFNDNDIADLRQRMGAAFEIDGRPFLFHRFKKGNDTIAEDKERNLIYFFTDKFYNIYKAMPKDEFVNEIQIYINDGWVPV